MRIKKLLRLLTVASIFGVASTTLVMHSCRKDVEPISFYKPDAVQTVEYTILNSDTKAVEDGVAANITFPEGGSTVIESSDGIVTIDIKGHDDGDLVVSFEKSGFVTEESTIVIDRSKLEEGSDWSYPATVLLTEANETFAVEAGVEATVEVEGSDASVVFPENALTEDAEISVTEMPAAAEEAEATGEVVVTEGRVAFKSFDFQPDGQTFEEPIEVTMELPDPSKDYVFSTFENGAWEDITVVNNGDGTGTAKVSHFSGYILTTKDVWEYQKSTLSEVIFFQGDCDEALVATLSRSFDSDEEQTKDDFAERIQTSFTVTKTVERLLGYSRSISAQYTVLNLKNMTKGYTVNIPSLPVTWSQPTESRCHSGGAGQ